MLEPFFAIFVNLFLLDLEPGTLLVLRPEADG